MKNKFLLLFHLYTFLLAILAVSTLFFLGVNDAGRYIPSDNIDEDYLLAWIWAVVLGSSILLWPVPSKHKFALLECWLAKVFVVLGLMLLYEYYYQSLDSYSYFWKSKEQFSISDIKFGDGTENLYALTKLHRIILFQSFHAMKLTYALIGLIAIYIFYRAATSFIRKDKIIILYLIAFFPSVLFWSSILGKDPIVLLGISLYVYSIVQWNKSQSFISFITALMGIAIASLIRSWYFLILATPMMIIIIYQKNFSFFYKTIFIVLSLISVTFSIWNFSEKFSLETTRDVVETTNNVSRSWSEGGSGQEVEEINSIKDILMFAPVGVFTALFRPLIGELFTPFGILSGLENTLLLVLFLLAIKNIRITDIKQPIILWIISLISIWSILYGFVSSQNLGTAVRFKLQILPIFLLFILYFLKYKKPSTNRSLL